MAGAAKRLVLAFVVCGLAALGPRACWADPVTSHFVVVGNVFCDTCLAGFETPATTFIAGAQVRVQCRDRQTDALTYTVDGETDAAGKYTIEVAGEHADDICESVVVSSPDSECATPLPGRTRARIVLSHANGVVSDTRIANNLGFQRVSAIEGCAEILKAYQVDSEDS